MLTNLVTGPTTFTTGRAIPRSHNLRNGREPGRLDRAEGAAAIRGRKLRDPAPLTKEEQNALVDDASRGANRGLSAKNDYDPLHMGG